MKLLKNIIIGALVIAIAVIITFVLRKYIFNFDKKLTKEQKEVIEKYISDESNSYLENGMTFMSTHYFGDRYNDEKLEVYLWVMYSEYDTSDGKFEEYSGYSIPHVVIVNTKDDVFEIVETKTPKDGNEYTKSINSMFPFAVRGEVSNFHDSNDYKKLLKDHKELIKIYENYSKESE